MIYPIFDYVLIDVIYLCSGTDISPFSKKMMHKATRREGQREKEGERERVREGGRNGERERKKNHQCTISKETCQNFLSYFLISFPPFLFKNLNHDYIPPPSKEFFLMLICNSDTVWQRSKARMDLFMEKQKWIVGSENV